LVLYKNQRLVDQYAAFWVSRPGFIAKYIVELGVWDGGGLVFWFEHFRPEKHVGVDIRNRQDGIGFQEYVRSRTAEERIRTYWNTDQADGAALRAIYHAEFAPRSIDLVIDDCSHLDGPTRSSFSTLFPLLRPGGIYLIEDWAWSHWPDWSRAEHPWAQEKELSEFVFDLIESVGSNTGAVSSVAVYQGFAAVERGTATLDPLSFSPTAGIIRRPQDRRADPET
jgi:SAM-dependent methyltransferase